MYRNVCIYVHVTIYMPRVGQEEDLFSDAAGHRHGGNAPARERAVLIHAWREGFAKGKPHTGGGLVFPRELCQYNGSGQVLPMASPIRAAVWCFRTWAG